MVQRRRLLAQFNTFISDRIVSNLKAISASLLVLHKRCYVTQIDQIDVLVTPWLLFYSLSFVWSSSGASPRYAKGRASPLCVNRLCSLTAGWGREPAAVRKAQEAWVAPANLNATTASSQRAHRELVHYKAAFSASLKEHTERWQWACSLQ